MERAVAGLRRSSNSYSKFPRCVSSAIEGIPTTVSLIPPIFRPSAGQWGEPLLFGPGTIHVAHTLEERVPKQQLIEAVEIYQKMVKAIMQTRIEVGILGATGMVGQHFIKFLARASLVRSHMARRQRPLRRQELCATP